MASVGFLLPIWDQRKALPSHMWHSNTVGDEDLSWAVRQNTDSWLLYVAWTSSHRGVWDQGEMAQEKQRWKVSAPQQSPNKVTHQDQVLKSHHAQCEGLGCSSCCGQF